MSFHYFLSGVLESAGFHGWERGVITSPREHLTISGDIFDDHDVITGERCHWRSGQRPGIFLNILCIGRLL